MSLKWIVLDFETASGADLREVGAWAYSEDPTTEILCLYFSDFNGQSPYHPWHPKDGRDCALLWSAAHDSSVTFCAHNASFEKAIWRNIMMPIFGFPDVPNERWHCTQSVCTMKVIPQQMGHAVQVLGLPESKDEEGSAFTRSLSKPKKDGSYDRTPESLARVDRYCAQDIASEVPLHRRLGWLPPGERSVWLLDQTINERGLAIDLPFVRACKSVIDRASFPLAAEFKGLTGVKVTQREKFLAWLTEHGTSMPNMQKATVAAVLQTDVLDEETDDDNLEDILTAASQVKLTPETHRALFIRALIGSASIKKLDRMLVCTGADSRARGLLQYHGAGPGRWAGRLLQPQNFPRGTVKGDVEQKVAAIFDGDLGMIEMMFGPPVETVISSLRHCVVAEKKRVLLAGDFAGIEARIVLALSGQHDKVALMASGADVYCHMASKIYGFEVNENDHPEQRQTGKNSVLGLGFQMGARKFHLRYCSDQPFSFAGDVVRIYRKEWAPCVPKLWYALEKAAVQTVHTGLPHEAYGIRYEIENGWLSARLPSGRKLWYFNPRPCRKAMPWDPTDIRPGFTYKAMKTGLWKTIYAFGGLLTENVVQAIARDLMVAAMFKCEENNLPIVLTVHDEIVTEPEEKHADRKLLEQLMADTPDWGRELKIPVVAKVWKTPLRRYKK